MARTERLYYDDPYLLEFDANVVERVLLAAVMVIVLDSHRVLIRRPAGNRMILA